MSTPIRGFTAFVLNYGGVEDTAKGDLIRDIREDRNFPAYVKTRKQLLSYLSEARACERAVKAAKALWKQYEEQLYGTEAKALRDKIGPIVGACFCPDTISPFVAREAILLEIEETLDSVLAMQGFKTEYTT